MSDLTIDQAFRRYQEHGKPKDLEVVFEGTAAELLRVASHLTPDLHSAEDVVQATYLVAIESRDVQLSSQVTPWLLGILANLARKRQRDSQRRPDPDRINFRDTENPLGAAESSELSQAVSDAITRLPEPYQPVLNLHLRHGLSAQEIAVSLVRPPGTVRTQLVRAMEQLRKLLPAGFAAGIALAITPTRGLAAMKQAVLNAVPAQVAIGSAGAGVGLGSLWLMKKTLCICAILMVIAGLWWSTDGFAGGAAPAPDLKRETTLSGSAVEVGEAKVSALAQSPGQPSVRTAAPSSEVAIEETEQHDYSVRGRCIKAETGEPLVDCDVSLTFLTGDNRDPVDVTTTGTDGMFTLHGDTDHKGFFFRRLRFEAEGRVFLYLDWRPNEEKHQELGDVKMVTGCKLKGRLVDGYGRGVEGAGLSFSRGGEFVRGKIPEPLHSHVVKTGLDGQFELRRLLDPERWQVESPATLPVIESGAVIEIGEGQHEAEHIVRLAPRNDADSISGRVIDDQGLPVAGVSLTYFRSKKTTSGKDGSFEIHKRAADPVEVSFNLRSKKYERYQGKALRWGTHEHEIVLQTGAGVEVTVVDAVTGNAVEDYAARLFRDPVHGGTPWSVRDLRSKGHHDGGSCIVPDCHRGKSLLCIEADGYAPTRLIQLDVSDHTDPIVVRVHRHCERLLTIIDQHGNPIQGATVTLVRAVYGQQVSLATRIIAEGDWQGFRMIFGTPESRLEDLAQAMTLHAGQSDAQGKFILRGSTDGRLGVRIRHKGIEAQVVDSIDLSETSPLVLVVSSAATLTGRLLSERPLSEVIEKSGRGGGIDQICIQLVDVEDPARSFPARGMEALRVSNDGSFHFDNIPPGTWHVELKWTERMTNGNAYVDRHSRVALLAGLKPGEERSLDIDAEALFRAGVKASVELNARAHGNTELIWRRLDKEAEELAPEFTTVYLSPRGTISFPLAAGRYTCGLALESAGWPRARIIWSDEVHVIPKQGEVQLRLAFTRRAVTVQVLDVDGQPVSGAQATVTGIKGSRESSLGGFVATTDRKGMLLLDPAPSSRFSILVNGTELGPIDASASGTLVLRMGR